MKKIYRVFEEETSDNNIESKNASLNTDNSNSNTTQANPQLQAKAKQLRAQITELQNQLTAAKREYTNRCTNIENQIHLRNKALVDMGEAPVSTVSESLITYCKSKKLFESAQLSKADELCAAITTANDRLENLSYHIDSKSAMLFARKILSFINEKYWNDGEDHWNELEDYFRSIIVKSNISFSRKELNDFLAEFKNVLKENTGYTWIFGNKSISTIKSMPVKESLFNRNRENNLLFPKLPTVMPEDLRDEVISLIESVIDDIEYPDEDTIYDYFAYGFDSFWNKFDDHYKKGKWDNAYYTAYYDNCTRGMWNAWKDEIMQIAYDVYSNSNVSSIDESFMTNSQRRPSFLRGNFPKLPPVMPQRLHNLVYNIALEIVPDLEDPSDENEIYEYFEYALDDFWEEFDKIYHNEKYDDEIYYTNRLNLMWNEWKDEIMQIIFSAVE